MDELQELLALWNDEADRLTMTGEQLRRLETLLIERSVELYDGTGTPDDETMAELDTIAETLGDVENPAEGSVRSAIAAVDASETERTERAAELADRIRGQADGGDGEGGEGDAGAAGDGDGAEGEGEGAGTGDGAEGEGEGEAGGEAGEGEALPIAAGGAAAPPAPRTPPVRIGRLRARGPATPWNTPPDTSRRHLTLVASANMGDSGIRAGQPLDDPRDLSEAFLTAWAASEGYQGPRRKISVAMAGARRVEDLYPEDQILGRDPILNNRRIAARTSRAAITAAGGRCVPSEIRYDLPALVGTEDRPVRDDMLVRFGAERGGIVTIDPMVLSDVDGAIGIWSEENDQDPSDPATKPCLTVDCPDDSETIVDAITRCLQFGNFRSRYFGEQIQEVMDLTAVNHARVSDSRALHTVGLGSTQVTAAATYGTTRTLIDVLARATTQIRDRHRLPDAFPLHFGAPRWLLDNMQVDLARQMPVGTLAETLAVADATLMRVLEQFGVNLTLTLDDEDGATFGAQGDGALLQWPDHVVTYLYPEGTWLFLDGGMLDLGIVRDSILNSTNDFQVFAETFEGVHFHGVESYRMDIDICPSGKASALDADTDPCAGLAS